MVDAIGLETDFTFETNRKNYQRVLKTPEFHFLDLKFQTTMKSEMKKKKNMHFTLVPQF